jgi:mannose-6-phosphate isomerase-like protein (cupin superfamily)
MVPMPTFSLDDMLQARRRGGRPYEELVRVDALSAGIYDLAVDEVDQQRPHGEDEVYVVLRGKARATIADQTVDVAPGALLYVPAGVAHHFHDIEEDLTVVVVFAPPEGTLPSS